jgi:hypothetical protein
VVLDAPGKVEFEQDEADDGRFQSGEADDLVDLDRRRAERLDDAATLAIVGSTAGPSLPSSRIGGHSGGIGCSSIGRTSAMMSSMCVTIVAPSLIS